MAAHYRVISSDSYALGVFAEACKFFGKEVASNFDTQPYFLLVKDLASETEVGRRDVYELAGGTLNFLHVEDLKRDDHVKTH